VNKLKTVSLALLLFGAVSGGAGVWARWTPGAAKQPEQGREPEPLQAQDKPASEAKDAVPRAQSQPESSFPDTPGLGGMDLGFPVTHLGPMGGARSRKNSPNLTGPRSNFYMVKSSGIVVVESPDRSAMEAMSLETDFAGAEVWQRLAIPDGITATPIVSADTMALYLKGKSIDHVAAFSAYTGEWRTQHLLKRAEEQIIPVIGPGSALYQVGNDFYAFSAKKGTWGVLHLEGKEEATSSLSTTDVSVVQGNRLYIFGLKQGKWSKGVEMGLLPPRTDQKQPGMHMGN